MNKFQIGKKYNEIGKADPIAFIKWLKTALSDNLLRGLKGFLDKLINTLEGFDAAKWASNRKLHMPWDKKENYVSPDYYDQQRQKEFERGIEAVFKSIGMNEDVYFDPEMIGKAEVVQMFIDDTFKKELEDNPVPEQSQEYRQLLKSWKDSISSVDVGKNNYTFYYSIGGKERSLAVITRKELENILSDAKLETAPFLATQAVYPGNHDQYVVIDADNEVFKEIMLERSFNRPLTSEELNPEHPEPESEESMSDNHEKSAGEGAVSAAEDVTKTQEPENVKKTSGHSGAGKKPDYLNFKAIQKVEVNKDEPNRVKKMLDDLSATYEKFKVGVKPENVAKTYVRVSVNADKVHAGKLDNGEKAVLIQIPFTNKDPQKALYLKFSESEKVRSNSRVYHFKNDKTDSRQIIMGMTESFPLYDSKGMPITDGNGFQVFMTTDQLCSKNFLIRGEATGEDVVVDVSTPEITLPPHQEPITKIENGVLKFVMDMEEPVTDKTIPEGAEITEIDFNHKNVTVSDGAINDMPSLISIINAENVHFSENAVTGCPMTLSEYLTKKEEISENPEKEIADSKEIEQGAKESDKKEPTAYARQQLFNNGLWAIDQTATHV